jgi:hypothetical protein
MELVQARRDARVRRRPDRLLFLAIDADAKRSLGQDPIHEGLHPLGNALLRGNIIFRDLEFVDDMADYLHPHQTSPTSA